MSFYPGPSSMPLSLIPVLGDAGACISMAGEFYCAEPSGCESSEIASGDQIEAALDEENTSWYDHLDPSATPLDGV